MRARMCFSSVFLWIRDSFTIFYSFKFCSLTFTTCGSEFEDNCRVWLKSVLIIFDWKQKFNFEEINADLTNVLRWNVINIGIFQTQLGMSKIPLIEKIIKYNHDIVWFTSIYLHFNQHNKKVHMNGWKIYILSFIHAAIMKLWLEMTADSCWSMVDVIHARCM